MQSPFNIYFDKKSTPFLWHTNIWTIDKLLTLWYGFNNTPTAMLWPWPEAGICQYTIMMNYYVVWNIQKLFFGLIYHDNGRYLALMTSYNNKTAFLRYYKSKLYTIRKRIMLEILNTQHHHNSHNIYIMGIIYSMLCMVIM